jgi:hypothetical protein
MGACCTIIIMNHHGPFSSAVYLNLSNVRSAFLSNVWLSPITNMPISQRPV